MLARPSITGKISIMLNDISCKYTETDVSTDSSKRSDAGSEGFSKRRVVGPPGQKKLQEILIELPNMSWNLDEEHNIFTNFQPEVVINTASHNNESVFTFGSMSSRRNSKIMSNNELLIELPDCSPTEMQNLSQCNLSTHLNEIVIDLPVHAYSKESVLDVAEPHTKCDSSTEVPLSTNKWITSSTTTGKKISASIPELLIEFPMDPSTSQSKIEISSHQKDDCKEIIIEVPFNGKSLMSLKDSFNDKEDILKIIIDCVHRNGTENSSAEQDLMMCPTCFGTWSTLTDFEKHLEACNVDTHVQSEIDSLPLVSQSSEDINVVNFAMLYNILNRDEFRNGLSEKLPVSCYFNKEGNDQSKVKQNNSFTCKFCLATLNSNRELVKHVKSQHKQYNHQCLYCHKLFYCSRHLNIHMRVHIPSDPEQCPLCDKAYTDVSTLENHIARVHGPGPSKSLECDICGKCFSTRKDLTAHVWGHKKKCVKCEYCGKIYKALPALKEHLMNVHTGEKPFQCPTCGKKFTTKSYLKLHEALHEVSKQFLCHICGQSFAIKQRLLSHVRKHQPEKKTFADCQICGKRLSKSCMRDHLRTHTGEKPFTCKVCGHSCVQRQSMKVHVQAKHKGVNVDEAIEKCC